jgi:molybdenum cofactor guanylyltransferase
MIREPPSLLTITGVILAGGRGRRMGGLDKGLIELDGRPLIEWVITALAPQVGGLMISANRNQEIYERYRLEVVTDTRPGYQGPLAGMLSTMEAVGSGLILTVPCDGPFLAPDLVRRLTEAMIEDKADLAVAAVGGRLQPVYTLQPVALAPDLLRYLGAGGRKVEEWLRRHRLAVANFDDQPMWFTNINSPEDAERLADVWREIERPVPKGDLDRS